MRTARGVLALCLLLVAIPAAGRAAPAVSPGSEFLVLFAPGTPDEARDAIHAAAGGVVTGRVEDPALDRVAVTDASLYRAGGLVLAVEPQRVWTTLGVKPKDPLLRDQWGLKKVKAFDAWRIERGLKKDVTVAVLDTGIDASHEDLEGRLVPGYDFVNLDEQPQDDEGHGTHVAGIIGANSSNRKGIAGLSWGTKIMPIKVCEAAGSCPTFDILAGAVDSVRRGADILNLSLGGAGACDFISNTIFEWIRDQGAFTVVAAGNSALDGNPSMTPANCDNTFAVGAIDEKGKPAPFSSHGNFVDISAPGVMIWSTYPPVKSFATGHIGYAPLSGTSMASPMVAGVAALVKARHPDWTPAQIEERLLKSATDAGPKGRDDRYGKGVVNAFKAVR